MGIYRGRSPQRALGSAWMGGANAVGWMDANLSQQLLDWPEPAPAADQPFLLMLQRGRVYLRMQNGPTQPPMQHVLQLLATAGENALRTFPARP